MATLSPEMLAHRYDDRADAVHFLLVDRATRRTAAFLTDIELKPSTSPYVVPRGEAIAATEGQGGRLGLILHSAFCCSTLLANAYDRPGRATSLKEPMLLQDITGFRHRGAQPAVVGARLSDALKLLVRPFEAGEVTVIKPSNIVNGLGAAMIQGRPEAHAVLLYAPLKLYLNSIARKGLWGRNWVRDLLLKLLKEGLVDLGFEQQDYFLQTDLQVAAIGWLAQHALFARIARAWPDRVRTLDSERMLAAPGEALAALDRLFAVADDDSARAAVVAREFRRNAKFGGEFSAADRIAGQAAAAALHAEEIDFVEKWAIKVAEARGVEMELPQPLLG